MTVATFAFLLASGIAAGLSGSMAGIASLFSYPALLAAGLPAVSANVTNTVALTFSSVGSTLGSRPELVGQGPVLRRFALLVTLGGAAGAGLLLVTPPQAFVRIVPVLVAGSAVVLLLAPRIRARVERARPENRGGPAALAGIVAVAIYGGYFGAAAGVLLLALLLIALPVSLLQGNALKNVLLGMANAVAALGFAVLGPVDWPTMLPVAIGALIGSRLGPVIARRLPTAGLRVGIGLCGLGLAAVLAAQAW